MDSYIEHFGMISSNIHIESCHFGMKGTRPMSNPRKQNPSKSDSEWYRIIMDCRKSGLSDARELLKNNQRLPVQRCRGK